MAFVRSVKHFKMRQIIFELREEKAVPARCTVISQPTSSTGTQSSCI